MLAPLIQVLGEDLWAHTLFAGVLGIAVYVLAPLLGCMCSKQSSSKESAVLDPAPGGAPVPVVASENTQAQFGGGGCPFGFNSVSKRTQAVFEEFKAKQTRVILLYEDYIHLPALKAVWDNPVTAYPRMEPYFAAACHGLELCFLLLAEFSKDRRLYLSKRPRMELVVRDIIAQSHLLSDLLDGELEDTSTNQVGSNTPVSSNTAESHKPPVTDKPGASVSPGLAHLHGVMEQMLVHSTSEERASLCVMIRSIVSTFTAVFADGALGLGIEHQLSELGKLAGLQPNVERLGRRYIDYASLVRPQVVASTLFDEDYRHDEDFFFRTVHLGTDCWAFIAVSRVTAAKDFAAQRRWYQAAVQIRYAAAILNYLGDHVLLLTSMVLRDYLELKVEIQGTSGEGSLLVKSFRSLVTSLVDMLVEALVGAEAFKGDSSGEVELDFESGLSYVYSRPDTFPGLYEYCKALEAVESALLGGFYYKHFLLANNVIGSSAKGTMNRSVAALKATFETNCFPVLDKIRAKLGAEIDAELSHNKGLIMDKIAKRHSLSSSSSSSAQPQSSAPPFQSSQTRKGVYERCRYAERGLVSSRGGPWTQSPAGLNATGKSNGANSNSGGDLTGLLDVSAEELALRDRARRSLYDESTVAPALLARKRALCQAQNVPALQFLDHAYGFVPPAASEAALQDVFSEHCGLGNFSWDLMFGKTMPEASANVKNLLGLSSSNAATVAFAHNSHELVTRLISSKLERLLCNKSLACEKKLVIVTSDSEFFSFTRQINRLIEGDSNNSKIRVVTVMAEPLHSFEERFVDAVAATVRSEGRVDIVYLSQISFTQKTLVTDVPAFVAQVRNNLPIGDASNPSLSSLVIIDGYHGFGALPTSLVGVDAIYLGGILKHVGGGANLCFAVVPPCYSGLRPMITGWLADVSVLGPGSPGVNIGSKVGYTPGLSLMGSTPAFHAPMLVFNHVMRLWRAHSLTVSYAHRHVVSLQKRFLAGLSALEDSNNPNKSINMKKLVKSTRLPVGPSGLEVEAETHRSHTLGFLQQSPEEASAAVKTLRDQGIGIDCRGSLIRIGFGLNHNPEDVDRLLSAVRPM